MLKPIKNFLTYLQRNANSSNIFGLTATMGTTEQPRLDETMMIANEDLASGDGDPLYDPLALDDDCPSGVTAEAIRVHGISAGTNVQVDDDDDDEDGVGAGEIILVDVTTLKSSMNHNEQETEDDDEDEEEETEAVVVVDEQMLQDTSTELLTSDQDVENSSSIGEEAAVGDEIKQPDSDQSSECMVVGANCDETIVQGSDSSVITLDSSSGAEHDSFTIVPDDTASSSVVRAVEDPQDDTDKAQTVLPNGHHTVVDAPDALDSVEPTSLSSGQQQQNTIDSTKETPTSEQIRGAASGAEEEEASDGSDSGLGLEPTRNVAATASTVPLELPPNKSSLKRRSEPLAPECGALALMEKDDGVSSQKRVKKGITFEGVTVFYFPRIQGFGCVPSQGGCTLGMEFQHVHSRRLTLAEHSSEQRKVHRQQLQEQNPRSSSSDDTSSEEEPSESGSEAESESYGFLQPVTTRQRRSILKAAGVRKIDPTEKDECREIRTSREVCGCTCRNFCNPETCACSLAGIKCQVDRPSFPCGCTQDGCANRVGRVEFNPGRVRTHFIHTIMRLSLEDKETEVRRTVVANGTGAVPGVGSSTTDSGVASNGGYMGGSEKNWSDGPIRLSSGMVYGSGMHSVPSSAANSVITDGLVSMNHHSLSPPYHQHQPVLPMQHQHFALPAHLQQPENNYMFGSAYHNYLVASDTQMYLAQAPSSSAPTIQHPLIGGLIPPAHSTESVDLHCGYRDFFRESSAEVREQLLSHAPMYYDYDSSNGAVTREASATDGSSLSRQQSTLQVTTPVPLHQVSGTGSISPYHQTVPTEHDRHLAEYGEPSSAHSQSLNVSTSTGDTSVEPSSSSSAVVEGDSALKIRPRQTSASLDTPDGLEFACSEPSFSANRTLPLVLETAAECHPESAVADVLTESVCLDSSSQEMDVDDSETAAAEDTSPSIRFQSMIDVDATEKSRGKRNPPSPDGSQDVLKQSDSPRPSGEHSCFIDLTTADAGNAERLEAINDLLACSRRTAKLARPSIAAEDDDELRDFRHSPVMKMREESPIPTLTLVDESSGEADDVNVVSGHKMNSTSTTVEKCTTLNGVNGNKSPESVHQNGTSSSLANKNALDEDEDKRLNVMRPCLLSDTANTNGTSDPDKPVDESHLLNKLVRISEPATAPLSSANSSLEPSENLCEIIKNSIVETTVSH